MESGQGEQPAVYLEVVEAGSGTEVTSSDGQVNLVQEEMVIDNGNVRAVEWLIQMLRRFNCNDWKCFTFFHQFMSTKQYINSL